GPSAWHGADEPIGRIMRILVRKLGGQGYDFRSNRSYADALNEFLKTRLGSPRSLRSRSAISVLAASGRRTARLDWRGFPFASVRRRAWLRRAAASTDKYRPAPSVPWLCLRFELASRSTHCRDR